MKIQFDKKTSTYYFLHYISKYFDTNYRKVNMFVLFYIRDSSKQNLMDEVSRKMLVRENRREGNKEVNRQGKLEG